MRHARSAGARKRMKICTDSDSHDRGETLCAAVAHAEAS
jgi:hypothetical protein